MVFLALKGGGEMIGRLVKRTPTHLFLDIGPTIVDLPLESVSEALGMEELEARRPAAIDQEEDAPALAALERSATGQLLSQTEIVERAKSSVVLISNPGGAGSGFVLDTQGRIVTNHHVIRGERYQTVNIFRESDGQWERVVFNNVPVHSYSPLYDIAVLQLDLDEVKEKGVELVPLPIAEPGSLRVGDAVYAIGNPGVWVGRGRMLEHTVSEGIVSSLSRNVRDVLYIQTTAAVNPGNSGGPLVNREGRVVGLVTLKAAFQEGIGFALPTSLIHHFLDNRESYAFSDQAENRGFRYLPPP